MSFTRIICIAAVTLGSIGTAVNGQIISGRPVPQLAHFDDDMAEFMDLFSISAGVLGIMKDGKIVYLRGFGTDYFSLPLPENTPFRIASCTKPFTAAAVQKLIAEGAFSKDDAAFNFPAIPDDGILNVNPWPVLIDQRLLDVTVDHLLRHRGGWWRDLVGDWTYHELEIADDMDITSPPGRVNTMNWILGQSLQFAPGSSYEYSNIGYLALGLIVEQETGQSLLGYLRSDILTPDMWVPFTELQMGRTFRSWQDPREPFYNDDNLVENVFDNVGDPLVFDPYGGWDHEARTGQGRIVASAATMLEFADRYRVGISPDIGKPRSTNPLSSDEAHGGALAGVNSYIYQRTDGVNAFIVFNERAGTNLAELFKDWYLKPYLDANTINVQTTSDGFWTTPDGSSSGVGGYHRPFGNFTTALNALADGSKIRMKPGVSAWTGTIDKQLLIDAPLGPVTIGQQ